MEEHKCIFNIAWVGLCNQQTNNSKFCIKHELVKCVSCGRKAIRECEFCGFLVCGAPLCADCDHLFDKKKNSYYHGPKV